MGDSPRALRADARRNRDHVVQVAFEAFAAEGLSVPVQEIARRAGVGTGTVSRHFPTKEALFEAAMLSRAQWLAEQAAGLAAATDPGAAFFGFLRLMVEEGSANRGVGEALAGDDFDLDAACRRAGFDLMAAVAGLLARAQRAGRARPDADAADVKALIRGCLARTAGAPDPAARDRMINIVTQGLAARPDQAEAAWKPPE